jgi:hypothetical protein
MLFLAANLKATGDVPFTMKPSRLDEWLEQNSYVSDCSLSHRRAQRPLT